MDQIRIKHWTLMRERAMSPGGWYRRLVLFFGILLLPSPVLESKVLANNSNTPLEYNLLDMPNARVSLNKLNKPATLLWHNKPLRQGMQELAKSHQLSLWVDRRVDPNQLLKLQTRQGDTLGTALESLSQESDVDLGLLENVLYVGPPNTLPQLQRALVSLHDELSKRAKKARTEMRAFDWEELATPMNLVQQLESTWAISVSAELPHDLMHAGRIENCTLATQLTLIGSGFGLEPFWEKSSDSVAYRLLGAKRSWTCTYELKTMAPIAKRTADLAKLVRRHKGRVTRRGELMLVQGPTALHQALLVRPAGKAGPPDNAFANSVYTFEVKNEPVEGVLRSLAGSLGLTLDWGAAVTSQQRLQTVSLDIKQAKVDDLLRQLGESAGLQILRSQMKVTILPGR